jgi:glycine cleavage system transcriptional repressor
MTTNALVSVSCPDRLGLVSAITGCLFDLGANLGDTTFAVLGEAAEFISVVEVPSGTAPEAIEAALRKLPELSDAEISVSPFTLAPVHGPSGQVNYRITVSGGDRPGLVARLSEVFVEFKANIVRLNAERIVASDQTQYAVIIAVYIPEENARSCLATVANTAGGLGLSCAWEEI